MLKVNPKFENLFAPLSTEEYTGLEQDMHSTTCFPLKIIPIPSPLSLIWCIGLLMASTYFCALHWGNTAFA